MPEIHNFFRVKKFWLRFYLQARCSHEKSRIWLANYRLPTPAQSIRFGIPVYGYHRSIVCKAYTCYIM